MSVSPYAANRDVSKAIFKDYVTKKTFFNCDYANVTTTEVTGETSYAYSGSGHSKRIAFDGEKGGTIKIETQIQPFKLYSLMSGADIGTSMNFIRREVHTTTTAAPTITLKETPIGKVDLFLESDDCGTEVPNTVAGTTVTLTTPKDGTYIVYYEVTISADIETIEITSTTFPKYFTVFMECLDKTDAGELVKFYEKAHKCHPQNNFTLSQSNTGDAAVLTITCDLLEDADKKILTIGRMKTAYTE